jgi:hypothetical protein
MERLTSLSRLSGEECDVISQKLISEEKWNELNEYHWDNRKLLLTTIVSEIIALGDIVSTDKQFREITEIIRSLKDSNNFQFDIHDENVMIRRTSHGPQLVITDPLS